MTDQERNNIEQNYLIAGDIVVIAQKPEFYPMSGQLHLFIEELCACTGWPTVEVFRRIFKERLDRLEGKN